MDDTAQKSGNKRLIFAGVGALVVALLAWLAFGFFGIQSAFIDDEVSEDGPIFASGASAETVGSENATETTEEDLTESTLADAETESTVSSGSSETETTAVETTAATEPQVVTLFSGSFSGTSRYDVSGTANVLNDGSEQRFLRFEDNFASSNGPDLKVWLRSSDGDFVNLGPLKGNIGAQNYEIPVDVDLEKFNTIDIWCERFSTSFGDATLNAS